MLKTLTAFALAAALVITTYAQDAKTVVANASKALGADSLSSISYSGTAADVNFLQTRNINGPWPLRPITNYTRTIDLSQQALRSSGVTNNQGLFGGAPVAGVYNQNITPASATWTQQVDYWVTPWGFLKGAVANNATVRSEKVNGKSYQVVSWSPAAPKAPSGSPYTVNGYINDQNLVERVETWVDHDMLGDMHVETSYSDYKDFGGVKVPAKMTQKRGGFTFFETTVASAQANPANLAQLLTPPGRAGGGGGAPGGAAPAGGAPGPPAAAAAAPPAASTKIADGVYRINGAYNALAVEFKDYVVVVEGPQSVARGQAVVDEVKKVFPNKRIGYVVNTHPHSDHAGGLAPFVAEGATIVTYKNNARFMADTFSAPRTLVGDNLAKTKRKPKVEGIGEKREFKDGNRSLVLYHITDTDTEKVHSDGIIVAFLPKEKVLFQADFTLPNAGAQPNPFVQSLGTNLQKLRLDFDQYLSVHNTTAVQTRADLMKATGTNW